MVCKETIFKFSPTFPQEATETSDPSQQTVAPPPPPHTCPVLITYGEEAGLVGELRQQAGAAHHHGLGDHDGAGHQPDECDALARALGRALEHQGVANGVPAVLGDAAQGQHRHGHGDGLVRGRRGKTQRRRLVLGAGVRWSARAGGHVPVP